MSKINFISNDLETITARCYAQARYCLSVRLSVTVQYCIKMAQLILDIRNIRRFLRLIGVTKF